MKIISDACSLKDARRVLIHEHIFCRFRTENYALAQRYLVEEFDRLQKLGVDAVIDTTTYVTPDTLSNVPTNSAVSVACSAGYYTERFISKRHRGLSAEELARLLTRKVRLGTGKGKFIPIMLKCGSGGTRPGKIEEKAIAAVAQVKSHTGMPMQIHSCDGAEEQYEIISRYSDQTNIMFCHIEMGMKTGRRLSPEATLERCLRILDRGNYIYFNDFGATRSEYQRNVFALVSTLVERGFSKQICVGTDSNWSVRGRRLLVRGVSAESPNARRYSYIHTHTIPNLRRSGISEESIEQICYRTGKDFALSGYFNVEGITQRTETSREKVSEEAGQLEMKF